MSVLSVIRHRILGFSQAPSTDWNIRYLYLEIVFAAVLGAVANFNAAFVIRLGVSQGLTQDSLAQLSAWLSAAPALIAAILSVPSARFIAKRKNRKLWLFMVLLLNRAGYGVVALIPLFFHVNTAAWLVLWIVMLNLPAIFFGNGF